MVAALFMLPISGRAVDSSVLANHSTAAFDLARLRMGAVTRSSAVERRASWDMEADDKRSSKRAMPP